MLVSRSVDAPRMSADVCAVVIDEVHAFAGDDRGWHLLAVLERLSGLAGQPLQRVGLSATVGNPDELLQWLQGRAAGRRPASVIAPEIAGPGAIPELSLDYVGSEANAAVVLSQLYLGEKRLVSADSRRSVEGLSVRLRERGVETYTSHSSPAIDERRRAEAAFAEARDCVIVSTSTLELGVDVGTSTASSSWAPRTVSPPCCSGSAAPAGDEPGTSRNMTFLVLDDLELMRAAGLLALLSEGFVDPVIPPPHPRHVAAQQFLGAALQKGRIDVRAESSWMAALGLATSEELAVVGQWLVDTGHLDVDSGLAFVEPSDHGAVAKWSGDARAYSFQLSDAIRRVLLGTDPPGATLSRRAVERLTLVREKYGQYVHPEFTVLADDGTRLRWWTFAGARANAVLTAALEAVAPEVLDAGTFSNLNIGIRGDTTPPDSAAACCRWSERCSGWSAPVLCLVLKAAGALS